MSDDPSTDLQPLPVKDALPLPTDALTMRPGKAVPQRQKRDKPTRRQYKEVGDVMLPAENSKGEQVIYLTRLPKHRLKELGVRARRAVETSGCESIEALRTALLDGKIESMSNVGATTVKEICHWAGLPWEVMQSRLEKARPLVARKVIRELARGTPITHIIKLFHVSFPTIKEVARRNQVAIDAARGRLAAGFVHIANQAQEHALEVLPEAGFKDTMVGAVAASDQALKLLRKDEDVADKGAVKISITTETMAKMMTKVFENLAETGLFSKKVTPVDVDEVVDAEVVDDARDGKNG